MTSRSRVTKDARKLEKLYATKAHDVKHTTVLRLIREQGLEGAIQQLEAWGMKPIDDAPACCCAGPDYHPDKPCPVHPKVLR